MMNMIARGRDAAAIKDEQANDATNTDIYLNMQMNKTIMQTKKLIYMSLIRIAKLSI